MSEDPAPGARETARPRRPVPPPARLRVLAGPGAGEYYTVGARAIMGRGVDCDIVLADERVSRMHAEISMATGGYLLRDLGSSNGILVNDEPVVEALLAPNDVLTIGDVRMRFLVETGAAGDSAARAVVLNSTTKLDHRVRIPGGAGALRRAPGGDDDTRAARVQQHLQALEQITETLGRLRGLEDLYPLVLDEILAVLPADRAALFTTTAEGAPQPQVVRNRRHPGEPVDVSRTILDEVASSRLCILSADAAAESQFDGSVSIAQQQIRSVVCVPMEYDGDLLGVVYLDTAIKRGAFTEEDLRFVGSVAAVAAVAICNARALHEVRLAGQRENRAYLAMLEVLANAIEARDHYTIGHTWRVTRFAQVVAQRLGWDGEKIEEIEVGGMLHDIGKIGVPDAILRKPGPLGAEEYEQMKLHPSIGARMLRDVGHLQHIIPYVLWHQERWDGHGYPDGLAGDDIPIEARVLAVADSLDAMTSTRPYRRAMEPEAAIGELQRQRGRQFDPEVIDALMAAHDAGELHAYLQVGAREAAAVLCPFCSTYFQPGDEDVAAEHTTCPTCRRELTLREADERMYAELA